MAGNLAALQQRLNAIQTALGNLTPYSGADLPNAQGGGNYDLVDYRESLLREEKELLEMISIADGPWELGTTGVG